MRVSACCHDPFPSSAAHTQQIFWTLLEVARRGVDVRLHVPRTRRARREGERQAQELAEIALWYGVSATAVPERLTIRQHPGTASPRWWSQASFDFRIPPALRRDAPDLVWTRNVAAAVWLTRAGLPTIFETYRPDLALDPRFAPWRRMVLRSSALRGLVHHSRVADEAFAKAGVPAHGRLLARNGYAPDWMEPRLGQGTARRLLDLPTDGPIVVYTGDVHPAKGIAALVRMAAAIPDARVLIVGANDEGAIRRTEALAAKARAANVIVRERVPIGQLSPYLYAADVLVIPPPAEPLSRSRTVLPIKVFLYLAAGRAIVGPRRADIEEVLEDGVTAQLCDPDDERDWVDALRTILDAAPLRQRLGQSALALSGEYTWEKRAARIVEFFERVASRPAATRWARP